jgi:hypothetical protein
MAVEGITFNKRISLNYIQILKKFIVEDDTQAGDTTKGLSDFMVDTKRIKQRTNMHID